MAQGSLALPPLPPSPSDDGILSVSELNEASKKLLEQRFGRVRVKGEIADLRVDRVSGHRYFTLKDQNASISAALFRSMGARLRFEPKAGQQVLASGQVTLYPRGGRYQIVVSHLEPAGAGALQAAIEAVKAKLLAEGLLDPSRKRPLPQMPRRVAVITSAEGAVWRDIVHVAQRRFGKPPLLLVPTRVQGANAVQDLLIAIGRVRAYHQSLGIDVVIVARGGGSLEDLMAFNDESVARALADMPIPTVSAIGHETDVSVLDLVADVRAPTPSAAAELVFAQRQQLAIALLTSRDRLARVIDARLQRLRLWMARLATALGDGKRLLWPKHERLSEAQATLERQGRKLIARGRGHITHLQRRLAQQAPARRIERLAGRNRLAASALQRQMEMRLRHERQHLMSLEHRLRSLSPLSILGRGYALATLEDGTLLRTASQTFIGQRVSVRLQSGQIRTVIDGVEDDNG